MSVAIRLADLPPALRARVSAAVPGRKTPNKLAAAIRVEQARFRLEQFTKMLERAGLPAATTEHRFHTDRDWRFDFAWPAFRIALEVEGGVWTQGRHTRGAGFVKDMEKYNAAAVLGWRVLRVTPDRLTTRGTEELLRKVLKVKVLG